MAAEWHYTKGGKQHGPVSAAELKALAKSGELSPTDMVWKEGMAKWKTAGSLKGLFAPPTESDAKRKSPPPLDNSPTYEPGSPLQMVWKYCKAHPVRCTAIGFGTFILLTLFGRIALEGVGLDGLIPLFIYPMLLVDFLLLVLLAIFGVKAFSVAVQYENLVGKWNPNDGRGEPFEIAGKTITRGNSLVGTIAVHKDQRLEISSGGKVTEVWQLVKLTHKELVFQDASGEIKRYTKKTTNLFSTLFNTSRADHLQGSWQPITESNERLQFTKDGAVVFSDGSAGRYTVSGEEPNEVIEMEMVSGQTRQFKVVSLTSAQLVIAEGNEATTFRRPGKVATKRDQSGAAATNEAGEAGGSEGTAMSKGFLGGLFAFFTKWKCSKCGQRSGNRISSKRISEITQRIATRQNRYSTTPDLRQVVVNEYTVLEDYRCESCNHEWQVEVEVSDQA